MKKRLIPVLLATLAGCGTLPTTPGASGDSASGEVGTATSSLYRILGLDDAAAAEPTDSIVEPNAGEQPPSPPQVSAPGSEAAPESRAPFGHDLLFLLLDTDGNGKIEAAELKSAIQSRRKDVTDQAIADLFKKLDRNGDGGVDASELAPPRGQRPPHGKPGQGFEGRPGGKPHGPPPHPPRGGRGQHDARPAFEWPWSR